MNTLTSTLRRDGDALATTVPADVAAELGLAEGDTLLWMEDAAGVWRVTSARAAMLRAHQEAMAEYSDTFMNLAE